MTIYKLEIGIEHHSAEEVARLVDEVYRNIKTGNWQGALLANDGQIAGSFSMTRRNALEAK